MCKITLKETLSDQITLMKIEAPDVTRHAKAGQFVILRVDQQGERIPLTIADVNTSDGTITIIFQVVGKTTYMLNQKDEGMHVEDFVGPLGMPTHIENLNRVLVVSGGVGAAIAYPVCKALNEQHSLVDIISGFKNKSFVILEDWFKKVSHKQYYTTDDGSFGEKGFVTDILKKVIEENQYDHVFAVGPIVMMKAVSKITKAYHIPTTVSLNPIMVDGTGMCGGCRVKIGDSIKFACVDGPDFDGHQVDYDNLLKRNQMYLDKETKDFKQLTSRGDS